jgi:hypothetical protein
VRMVEALSIKGREKTRDILAQDETVTQCPILPPNDYRIQKEPIRYPYVDLFCEDDVSHFHHAHNHLHNFPNRLFAYEENFNYGEEVVEDVKLVEEVKLLSKKTYVQPPSLIPMTTSMEEELPPPPTQVQLPPP